MTAICLPVMLRKKRGIIINNASASGRLPTPLLTVYSASKAYMDFFSRSLSAEYATKGIIVQSLCPYFVSTKLSKTGRSLLSPKPAEYVSSALRTIGAQPVTNGCLVHNIQVNISITFISKNINKILIWQILFLRASLPRTWYRNSCIRKWLKVN